jgi:hypothetical protein
MPGAVGDPNWLLSTLAQSTAALVAIVGGFLVSRLITLQGERRANDQRVTDAEARERRMAGAFELADEEALLRTAEDLVDDNIEELLDARGEGDVEQFLEAHGEEFDDRYRDELRSAVAQAAATMKRAFEAFEFAFDGIRLPDSYEEGLVSLSQQLPRSEERRIYEEVFDRLKEEERDKRGWSLLNTPIPTMPALRGIGSGTPYEELTRARDRAEGEHDAAVTELNDVRAGRDRLPRPRGIWAGFAVLAYFAGVGLVAPVIVLASQPTSLSTQSAVALVLGFVSGLGALLTFFAWLIRSTSR